MEYENPGRRGRRRSGEACLKYRHKVKFFYSTTKLPLWQILCIVELFRFNLKIAFLSIAIKNIELRQFFILAIYCLQVLLTVSKVYLVIYIQ